ncbi:hypothetical protein LCGC14_0359560 [marine sediment metagenome]|uniref:Bacteriophage head to tail connecting protein n=1 Tax=marine sediment metagenome TaxID=412755 RepID=A0A0F9VVR6_9ZZZZ|nr:hypothetical protein [Candidatus Aminicenantes bacterium]
MGDAHEINTGAGTRKQLNDMQLLKKHLDYLIRIRQPMDDGIWKDLGENLSPYREDMVGGVNNKGTLQRGRRKATKIFDSSALNYLNIFADGLHGNMINPSIVWFIQRLPRQYRFLEDIPEVLAWMQDTQEVIYSAFQNSNFYSQMRQYFKDGGSIGTANLFVEEDSVENRLVFHALHPRESYIAEDKFGNVDTVFRVFPVTARVIKDMFGLDKMSMTAKQAYANNPFTEIDIVHAVYPNDEFDRSKLGNKFKKFASRWFERDAIDNSPFLREKGYDNFPFHVWRYYRGDPGPYGDSPGVFALAEIMGLQAMRKTLLRAGHISTDPAYNVPGEMKGKVRIHPGGMNYIGPDYNRIIRPVTTGIQYPIGKDMVEDSREILKRHFHVDFFLMLEQAERQMTAREVIERMGEKASILAASIGDLTVMLDSIIDTVFDIEFKAGRISKPPRILSEVMGGQRIPTEYQGPLAQAQRRLFETRGIVDSLEMTVPYMEFFPQVQDLINTDRTFRDLLTSFGFPQDNLNSIQEVEIIRENRSLQAQEEGTKVDMERMSALLKDLSQADKNSGGKLAPAIQQILAQSGVQSPGAVPV